MLDFSIFVRINKTIIRNEYFSSMECIVKNIIVIKDNYNFGILNMLMMSNLDGSANAEALEISIKKWLRRQDSLNALCLIAQREMALFISYNFLRS